MRTARIKYGVPGTPRNPRNAWGPNTTGQALILLHLKGHGKSGLNQELNHQPKGLATAIAPRLGENDLEEKILTRKIRRVILD